MKLIRFFFDKLGLIIEKKKYSASLEKGIIHPKELLYKSTFKRKIVLEADMNDGWALERFSLSEETLHPFVLALKAYERNKNKQDALNLMKKYYSQVQPKNLSEWFGIQGNINTNKTPPTIGIFPWDDLNVEQKAAHVRECAIHDSVTNSKKKIDLNHGWRNFGPVSEDLLQLEVERLIKVYESIKYHGYVRNFDDDGDIGAFVLINGDDWKWCVDWGGQHRIAALRALGYQKVKIKVWKIIYKDDYKFWPNVLNGFYSCTDANSIFENYFSNNSKFKEWSEVIENEK
ncbi:hypothetical protein M2G36_19500 [Vibrio vulnificus]|uniref:hypothetical protein n=1 Tax=Vibrio vulnificus TaxID=672 RepID=UPI00102A5AFD|nr:hypothetical protein [Vibrio vulnificus]EGR0668465.1 hypothetical protein [Vibrio vulnificus]EHU9474098.1 hypothetical protein [Vibrio vulnificus]EJB0234566.1 hypothetical protein [Vibrio vulnificus]EJO9872744.1 hypothetical protein [Vibrio vulnificus]EJP4177722.1 hypothetical protein [Vibrio vulnificus]